MLLTLDCGTVRTYFSLSLSHSFLPWSLTPSPFYFPQSFSFSYSFSFSFLHTLKFLFFLYSIFFPLWSFFHFSFSLIAFSFSTFNLICILFLLGHSQSTFLSLTIFLIIYCILILWLSSLSSLSLPGCRDHLYFHSFQFFCSWQRSRGLMKMLS